MTEKEIRLPDGIDVETAIDALREYAQTEDAQIISSGKIDSLESEIKEAKEAFAAVLSEESPQSAETLSRQDMDALTEPFRGEEGDIDVDTLRQIPETGEVNDDSDEGSDMDTLSASEKEAIQDKLERADMFESRTPEHAESLRGEAADIAGVEDADEIEVDNL